MRSFAAQVVFDEAVAEVDRARGVGRHVGFVRDHQHGETTLAVESDGARQSPLGESEPPDEILGPFGIAERLNWLMVKNRKRNRRSQCLIVERS